MGDYPDYKSSDVNLKECGFGLIPEYYNITLKSICFDNEYRDSNENLFELFVLRKNIERNRQMNTRGLNELWPSARIFNGPDAEYGEAPWTVYLEFRRFGLYSQSCTGVLITFEWVLTAAHCFDDSLVIHKISIF